MHSIWQDVGVVRKVFRRANATVQAVVPGDTYVSFMRLLYPLMDRKRRGSRVRFRCVERMWCAQSPRGDFYFNSPYKVGRYLFAAERDSIFAQLRSKYSLGQPPIAIEPGDVVVDIGANVGEFTVAAAATASLVIALEPDPSAFACLERNTRSLANVRALPLAVGERRGEIRFFLASDSNDSSVIEPACYSEVIDVLMRPLADILNELGVQRVNFLKVEAEGYEPEILRGAGAVLEQVEKVAVDVSPERHGESPVDECLEILHAAGFETHCDAWMAFGREGVKKGSDP